jgi:excisionase family DNA binding protein
MNMPIDASQHDQTEWISLHEASALLGVNSSTLRRWGDSGRVPMKRTLGGHRRFSRPAIMRLAEQQAGPTTIAPTSTAYLPAAHHGWNFDSRELARQEWHARLATGTSTSRMRGLGQRLLGLLIQYVNRHEDDHRFLIEARAVGESYARLRSTCTIRSRHFCSSAARSRSWPCHCPASPSRPTWRRRPGCTRGSTVSWMRFCWGQLPASRAA